MKKLFISCPMKGRTDENIKKTMEKMHKIAEITFGEELEVINSFIVAEAPERKNPPVWYLGRSILLMSEADYFVGIGYGSDFYHGCGIESRVAQMYGIKSMRVDMEALMPDAVEIEQRWWNRDERTPFEAEIIEKLKELCEGETPAELPPGEIVCDEIEEENNPSVSEADSSLCTKEPGVEVENEEVD
ncbi:MAG: hypothetical protein IKU60_03835 [Clostridia bacterium]|nr:hypothetical protein [Clostridia bacterium]